MKITSTRLLYLQPVLFKTISFHHQSEYYIQFQVKYRQSHIKNPLSAYPSIVKYDSELNFSKKKIFKPDNSNKVQTEKFFVLFNDQTITIKGGCNFIIQTERVTNPSDEGKNHIEAFLEIKLQRRHSQKDANGQLVTNKKCKIQKVGEATVYINLNAIKDYSEYSCYRHIVFTRDEYFASLLFYVDFAHMGINMRLGDSLRLNEFSLLSQKSGGEKVKETRRQVRKACKNQTLRNLLQFKDLRKLYKLLIESRLEQFRRVVGLYQGAISIRLKYLDNYEIQQPQNIESISFMKVKAGENFTLNLNHLQASTFIDNLYFHQYYETDDIDEIYHSMFNESKAINLNVRKVWERMNLVKLKTLPEEFMTYALKFKIDRLTYITQLYSTIDQLIYSNPQQTKQRIISHNLERIKVCSSSRFYNLNQLKHSMLTFHSEKSENDISNNPQNIQSHTLVVLVHGYQGSQHDMAKIKSFINTFTSINFLALQTLSRAQNHDIITLGKKGAEQIERYLQKKPYIQSINFIGFSLGGIIAKSILANLQHYKQKFNLFITLSSPHLGICQIQNCLVSTGVFWMKKVNRSKNIKELCCQPLHKMEENITLVTLSEQPVLSWFKHVVLIGSNQDTYVPKYSSLLAYRGSNKTVQKIQKNTLEKIKSLDRITVWFQYEQGCIDKLTGRKGHISFIEDDTFIEYIITKYLQFF